MNNWSGGSPSPTVAWIDSMPGGSNSAPVIDHISGNVYIAAGYYFYGLNSSNGTPLGTYNPLLYTSTPIYHNQVVSYPLYTLGSQTYTSSSMLWVSDQNGYLYAINPTTMSIVASIDLKARLDGSPTLVYSNNHNPYIVVGSAAATNNAPYDAATHTGGTGTLFVINPNTYKVMASLPNQFPSDPYSACDWSFSFFSFF